MKKSIFALCVIGVMTLSACGAPSNKVVISKAGDISNEEFYHQMKEQVGKKVLINMITERVFSRNYKVENKDVNKKYSEAEEKYGKNFENILKQQGLTKEGLKNSIRAQLAQRKAIEATITDKELKENYKPEIQASHILVKEEEAAKKIKLELEQGQSFEELAKKYSEDFNSKEKSGDLGYISPGKMDKAFEEAAYKLKKGEVSEPVKSKLGYHIIKVTNIKELKPFDQVKEDIRKNLIQMKAQDTQFMNDLIVKEIKKNNVKINDADLKNLFEKQKNAMKTT
jgi:foldase protein PrsA